MARGGGSASNYHVQALNRGLQVLGYIAEGDGAVTLIDLHEASALPKSTLVRLLSALTEEHYVVRVDERPAYRLGYKVLDLSRAYVSSLDISEAAREYLVELSERTGQTSNIGVLDGANVLHVAIESPNRPLRYIASVGDRADLYNTGLGKLLLSTLPESQVSSRLPARLRRITDHTIVTRSALAADLATTRQRGYAYDDNENSAGLRCLAVPLTHDSAVIAALSLSGASGEYDEKTQKRFLAALNDTAGRLMDDPEVVHALRAVPTAMLEAPTPSE